MKFLLCIILGLTFHAYNPEPYSPNRHDRFYEGTDRDFWAEKYDFSGIGWVGEQGPWVTMITDRGFVTAGHYRPGIGSKVTFYPDNTKNKPWNGIVVWTRRVTDTGDDACVGFLDSIPPPTIKRYPIISKGAYSNWYETTNCLYVGRKGSRMVIGTTTLGYNLNPPEQIDGSYIPLTGFIWENGLPIFAQPHYVYGRNADRDSGGPTLLYDDQNRLSLIGTHYTTMSDAMYPERVHLINAALASYSLYSNETVTTSYSDKIFRPKIVKNLKVILED